MRAAEHAGVVRELPAGGASARMRFEDAATYERRKRTFCAAACAWPHEGSLSIEAVAAAGLSFAPTADADDRYCVRARTCGEHACVHTRRT